MMKKKNAILVILIFFGVFLSGCTFVQVQNLSEIRARVLVRVPDSEKGYTKVVESYQLAEVFSGYGGRYSVTTLDDLEYRDLLESLQAQISERLFQEGATLSAEEVANLVARMNEIDQALANMANEGAYCVGSVPDFETAVVTLSWDATAGKWALNCQ